MRDQNKSDKHDYIKGLKITSAIEDNSILNIDILKFDIEGSERYLFDSNFDEWLPKVRILIIEFYDRLVPNSSKAFFNAICKYGFLLSQHGDNLISKLK